VDIIQLVRFIVVELIYSNLNPRFDMGDDVSVDSKTLLMTDFVNLKIKLA
jgi:hypothetical protein